MTDATDEERDWLKGQALFFRAYFNYEFVRSFGTIPYVDKVFTAEKQDMKRHWSYEKNGKTYKDVQAVFERIVEDFDEAADIIACCLAFIKYQLGASYQTGSTGF